jgi:antitoxin VapB
MASTAKVFMSGASQAIRLPKEFRFDSKEVSIKRIGSMILLFPPNDAWELMADAIGAADSDFMADRKQPARVDARKSLDRRRRKTR